MCSTNASSLLPIATIAIKGCLAPLGTNAHDCTFAFGPTKTVQRCINTALALPWYGTMAMLAGYGAMAMQISLQTYSHAAQRVILPKGLPCSTLMDPNSTAPNQVAHCITLQKIESIHPVFRARVGVGLQGYNNLASLEGTLVRNHTRPTHQPTDRGEV